MNVSTENASLISNTNLRAFYHDSLSEAMSRREVRAHDGTVVYLVNLLESFVRSEWFHCDNPEEGQLPALAEQYARAVNASSDYSRA